MAENASTLASSAARSRLLKARRSEISRGADVHQQKDRELALLGELLDERAAGARRDVPIDGAHLVAGAVFAHLVEVHAAAFEHRMICAGQTVVDHAARADLQLPHAAHDGLGRFGRCPPACDQGTGSVFKIFSITSSEVMFSASAS